METIIVYWGIYWGYIGVVLGLYWGNGKENGNYYSSNEQVSRWGSPKSRDPYNKDWGPPTRGNYQVSRSG